jgi:hypothetical protein
MKWSMDHVLTWSCGTEFMLTVDLHRLINSDTKHSTADSIVSECTKPEWLQTWPANGPRQTLTSVSLTLKIIPNEKPA